MKVAVEKALIPRPKIVCVVCEGEVKTVMSSPFNHGYHRRHVCKECGHSFYSLAPYDMSKAQTSGVPFHDDPITEEEEEERWDMWQRIKAQYVTFEVPLWQRIGALTIKQGDLTPAEDFALKMYRALEKRVKEMEDASPVE